MPLLPVATVKPGYTPQSEDTSIDADVLMFQLLRQLTSPEKAKRVRHFNQATRKLTLTGIKNQYPDAPLSWVRQEFLRRRFPQEQLTLELKLTDVAFLNQLMLLDPLQLATQLAQIFEGLDIPYLVGGSVASSLLGENRSTQDLDVVINISLSQTQPLICALEKEFYISESAVTEAVTQKKSFNVIHLASLEKADIFILGDDPFSISKMSRRQKYLIDESTPSLYIYSAEDIVLQKLRWYKLSARESQKQWRDVLGVLKIQGEHLDLNYLSQWAQTLQLKTLLEEALQQAGLSE